MPLGTVQKILVCGGTGETVRSNSRIVTCQDGTTVVAIQGYVINTASASRFDAAFEPFDYSYASGLWTMSFSMVVGLYVVSRKVGALLGFVRHG